MPRNPRRPSSRTSPEPWRRVRVGARLGGDALDHPEPQRALGHVRRSGGPDRAANPDWVLSPADPAARGPFVSADHWETFEQNARAILSSHAPARWRLTQLEASEHRSVSPVRVGRRREDGCSRRAAWPPVRESNLAVSKEGVSSPDEGRSRCRHRTKGYPWSGGGACEIKWYLR